MADDAKLSGDAALDQALGRALAPPGLPAGFRQRLRAEIARRPLADDLARRRLDAEREHGATLAALERDAVRLKLATLGTLIGGAFVAGVAVTLALPYVRELSGPYETAALATTGVVIAAWAGFAAWSSRVGLRG